MSHDAAADLEKVKVHETLLVFEHFERQNAWELGNLIRNKLEHEGAFAAIDIRRGEDCWFFTSMPGAGPANADWARRKRNLVNLVEMSSYRMNLEMQAGSQLFDLMKLDGRDHVAAGGCFPIRVKGSGVVGTVTVSGLPQRDDHRVVIEAISEYLGVDLGSSAF